jgi:hypothetical protein
MVAVANYNTSVISYATVYYSVAGELYANNQTTRASATSVVTSVVNNLLSFGVVANASADSSSVNTKVSVTSLTTEMSSIATVLADADLVTDAVLLSVSIDYIPDLMTTTATADLIASDDTDADFADYSALMDICLSLIMACEKLIAVAVSGSPSTTTFNYAVQTLQDASTFAASVALTVSEVGASYSSSQSMTVNGTSYAKYTTATKFNAAIFRQELTLTNTLDASSLPSCGSSSDQQISLPVGFVNSSDYGIFDCSFSQSEFNSFVDNSNRTENSDIVSINMYDNTSTSAIEYAAETCEPYYITITMSVTDLSPSLDADSFDLGSSAVYPACNFWANTSGNWSSSGCYVFNYTNTTVTCACSHLTSFQLSTSDFVP